MTSASADRARSRLLKGADPPPGSGRLRPQLDEFRSRHRVPALGAATVAPDGALDVEVVGTTRRGGEDAARRDDRWHIGSCGKSITGALYARLVERGDARWGATLDELLPDLAPNMDACWRTTTIDDLFAHRSGLAANIGRDELIAALRDARPPRDQRTETVAAALARPRRHRRPVYSNLGYVVAGAAIERITDLPFESALTRHVLEPLGITSGGFGPPPRLVGHAGRAGALERLGVVVGRGAPVDPHDPCADNPVVMAPAGRLHLTLEDWSRFQRVFLHGGSDFLRPATVEGLLTPARGPRGADWGLGWARADKLDGASWGQQGSNTYWVATALLSSDRTRSAMVVCNDGRSRMLSQTAKLAARLLSAS